MHQLCAVRGKIILTSSLCYRTRPAIFIILYLNEVISSEWSSGKSFMFVDESNAIITISVEVQYFIVVVLVAIPMQKNKPAPLLKVTCRHLNRSDGVKKTSENSIDRPKSLGKKFIERNKRTSKCTIFNSSNHSSESKVSILSMSRRKYSVHDKRIYVAFEYDTII